MPSPPARTAMVMFTPSRARARPWSCAHLHGHVNIRARSRRDQRPAYANLRILPTHSNSNVQRRGGHGRQGTASLRDAATTAATLTTRSRGYVVVRRRPAWHLTSTWLPVMWNSGPDTAGGKPMILRPAVANHNSFLFKATQRIHGL